MTQHDAASQCRVCDKAIRAQKPVHIFSPLVGNGKEADISTKSIAEMMSELADVTVRLSVAMVPIVGKRMTLTLLPFLPQISPDDERSKYICSVCLKALEKAFQLRQQIRAAERAEPTHLQYVMIFLLVLPFFSCSFKLEHTLLADRFR